MAAHLPIARVLIYTARVTYAGTDRVDITRQGADAAMHAGRLMLSNVLAPSWTILRPALTERHGADRLRQDASALTRRGDAAGALVLRSEAGRIESALWERYVPAYIAEMRESYRRRRDDWRRILEHGAGCCGGYLTLVCYCRDPAHCHRTIAGELLAKAGEPLGVSAVFAGECEPRPRGERDVQVIVCTRGRGGSRCYSSAQGELYG